MAPLLLKPVPNHLSYGTASFEAYA